MIDRDRLKQQIKDAKARQAAGNTAFIKEGGASLRVVPFYNKETKSYEVGREFTQWRPKGEGRPIASRENWNMPDVFDAVKASGGDLPWRKSTAYLVWGVDVAAEQKELRVWQIPTSVFEAMAEVFLDEEYDGVEDAQTGRPFKIKKTGSGLSTKYAVMLGEKKVDVSRLIKGKLEDPIKKIPMPSIAEQCEALGLDPDDFEDAEMEAVSDRKPSKKAPKEEPEDDEDEEETPPAKKSKKAPKPEPEDGEDEEEEEEAPPAKKSKKGAGRFEESEDDEDEEETPPAKKSKKAPKEEPEDDEDEEEEEEEEETFPPKKSSKPSGTEARKGVSIRDLMKGAKK
jgi:hypothetical protein